jgi:hypothetical protein
MAGDWNLKLTFCNMAKGSRIGVQSFNATCLSRVYTMQLGSSESSACDALTEVTESLGWTLKRDATSSLYLHETTAGASGEPTSIV